MQNLLSNHYFYSGSKLLLHLEYSVNGFTKTCLLIHPENREKHSPTGEKWVGSPSLFFEMTAYVFFIGVLDESDKTQPYSAGMCESCCQHSVWLND